MLISIVEIKNLLHFHSKSGAILGSIQNGNCAVYTADKDDKGEIKYSDLIDPSSDMDDDRCFQSCREALMTNCRYTADGTCQYQLKIPQNANINTQSETYECMLASAGTKILCSSRKLRHLIA